MTLRPLSWLAPATTTLITAPGRLLAGRQLPGLPARRVLPAAAALAVLAGSATAATAMTSPAHSARPAGHRASGHRGLPAAAQADELVSPPPLIPAGGQARASAAARVQRHHTRQVRRRMLARRAAIASAAAAVAAPATPAATPAVTPAPTTAPVPSSGVLTPAQVGQLWVAEGGPASQESEAETVAMCESGDDPSNYYGKSAGVPWTGQAAGLFEILGAVIPGSDLFNAAQNTANAVKKYDAAGGWSPWVCAA